MPTYAWDVNKKFAMPGLPPVTAYLYNLCENHVTMPINSAELGINILMSYGLHSIDFTEDGIESLIIKNPKNKLFLGPPNKEIGRGAPIRNISFNMFRFKNS